MAPSVPKAGAAFTGVVVGDAGCGKGAVLLAKHGAAEEAPPQAVSAADLAPLPPPLPAPGLAVLFGRSDGTEEAATARATAAAAPLLFPRSHKPTNALTTGGDRWRESTRPAR